MKSLSLTIPLFSLLLIFSCLKAQEVTRLNGLTKNNLKGQVKAVTTRVYFAVDNFGKIIKGRPTNHSDNSVILFDRNGNLVEQSQYDTNGGLEEKWVWLYDEGGNKVEEKMVFGIDLNLALSAPKKPYKPQPLNILWTYNYSFNAEGRIRYSTTHYRDRTQYGYDVFRVSDSSVYEYYANGKLKLKKSYSHPKENKWSTDIYGVIVSIYDNTGLVALDFGCSEIYEDLRLPKNKNKDYPPSLSAEEIVFDNSFDAGDFRGKLIRYDTTSRTSYTYQNSLLVQEVRVYKEDAPKTVFVTNYAYNSNGDLVKENKRGGPYSLGGSVNSYSFTYEYDHMGNWISRVKYENGVAAYFYTRDIKYY